MSDTPSPDDLDIETSNLLFYWGMLSGIVLDSMALGSNRRAATEANAAIWRLNPFVRALVGLGRAHPEELLTLWRTALTESGPFGMPPVGWPPPDPRKAP